MRTVLASLFAAALCTFAAPALHSQDSPAPEPAGPAHTYKLSFTVTQLVHGKEEGGFHAIQLPERRRRY
jgi:hypothetical protein